VEAAVDFPYGHEHHLRRLDGTPEGLTAEEQATLDALNAEHARLEAEYANADELPDEVDQRIGEIETALAKFEDRRVQFDPADIARAGAFVSIDEDGQLSIDRGYVRPEDEAAAGDPEDGARAPADADGVEVSTPAAPAVHRAVITTGGEASPAEDEDDAIAPLPERLLIELTAHRTLALRDAVAKNPHVAMTALLHKLCLDTFQHGARDACLEASVRHVFFPVQAADLKESTVAKAVAERHEAWKADLPRDATGLWDWLSALGEDRRAMLLAHCVSFGVNALHEKGERHGGPGASNEGVQRRISEADRLARAVGLDMVEAGWRPTAENYLGRVTKPRILDAVREARGEDSVRLIDHLKKGDMAKEAERLLEGTGWLPEPLRGAGLDDAPIATSEVGEALPDFLIGDDDDDAAGEEAISEEAGGYAPEAIAAE
jgi:ParB family chromosome partitioning protein